MAPTGSRAHVSTSSRVGFIVAAIAAYLSVR
jgi:hypothetical protein